MTRARPLGPVLAALVAAGAVAVPAFAHTEVSSTSPGRGATVAKSVSRVSVTFTQQIRSGSVRVVGPSGRTVSGASGRDPRDVKRLLGALRGRMRPGKHTVRWRMKAADGHTQRGSFTFRVR